MKYSRVSLSRLRLSRITAYLEEKIWFLFKHRNLISGNKILWRRGEIAPEQQFLPFPTIFSIYISNYRSLITYYFVKFGCAICIFLNSENLICRSSDISKYFRGPLQLRDTESRLYLAQSSFEICRRKFCLLFWHLNFVCFLALKEMKSSISTKSLRIRSGT